MIEFMATLMWDAMGGPHQRWGFIDSPENSFRRAFINTYVARERASQRVRLEDMYGADDEIARGAEMDACAESLL